MTFFTGKVDTTGSVADARGALGFLASVNAGSGWDKDGMLGGRTALPLEAMKRRHAHAVEKAPGLPPRLVLDVLRQYAHLQAGVQTERQWRLAIGVAIGCAFKLMARYADMCDTTTMTTAFECTTCIFASMSQSARRTSMVASGSM